MGQNKDEISVQRLEELKQIVILEKLADINLDKPKSLYETVIRGLFQGMMDDRFLSVSLEGLNHDQKEGIFQLGRKYQDLCFYKGNIDYWADSIEGIYLNDLGFVCTRILDNYDFLLGLIKDGGEKVLEFLMNFQNTPMSREGSVIDFLRNSFEDDTVLKNILLEMVKEDGLFHECDNQQKRILCTYPMGILYHMEDEHAVMNSYDEIDKLLKSYDSEKDSSFEDYIFQKYSEYRYQLSLEK